MSENEFQVQLASIMEILVEAAVRETTKLYRTGVLNLRIEMAQIKQENETLKSRLQFSDGVWRPSDPQEDRRVDNTIDSINQKCVQTEAEAVPAPEECCGSSWLFPNPSHQVNGEEEEEEEEEEGVTVSSPHSAFKEESPEVEFVLIKQEDSDVEEYVPGSTPLKHEVPSGVADRLSEQPQTRVQSAPLARDGGMAPVVMAPSPAHGWQGGPRRGSSCTMEPGGSSWIPQDPQTKRRGHTQGGPGGEALEGRGDINVSPWATAHDLAVKSSRAKAWPIARPEEQSLAHSPPPLLSRFRPMRHHFVDLAPRGSHEAHPQLVQSHQPAAEVGASQPTGRRADQSGGREEQVGPEPLPHHLLEGWKGGPGEPLSVLSGNGHQVAQGGFAFPCSQCGRVLSSATSLQAHRSLHTGERPYPCTQCGKTFPSLRGLNRHSQVHSGDRQHRCHQCGKSFVYQFSLTKHQLIHSGERAHLCKHCGKTFVFKSDLTIHVRVHTGEKPYSCTVCGKDFKHRRALNMHLQGHTGERRHHCPYCGKTFLDLGNFKRHKRIHTGEKPYSCTVCGKNFTQSAHLKKHFLTHK